MERRKKRTDYISARLSALNKLSYLLDMKTTTGWDFIVLCKIFVETVGYQSCWIALIDDTGEIKKFSHYEVKNIFIIDEEARQQFNFRDFIKETLVQRSDVVYNKDPLLDYSNSKSVRADSLHSITVKLVHNHMIYGILSVTLTGDYVSIKGEVLSISDFVKTISFFLYDIDNREKIINIFLTMFETTGSATIVIEEDTIISYANREFEKLSGCSKKEIENRRSFLDFVYHGDKSMLTEYHRLRRIDATRAPRNYEFRFIDRAGEIKNIYMTINLVPNTKMSIASFSNITDKKRLESEVLKVSELERQQLGNDLHDGLGPHLVGIKFMVKLLRQKIENGSVPELKDIDEINSLITQAIEHTRTITKGLKPVDIQSDGLIFALEELTAKVSSIFKVACSFSYDASFSLDNNIAATHLYYIIQEAVNNALKHANPKKVEVLLAARENNLIAEICDDGVGIPKIKDTEKGLGLNIMRYRADIINAHFDILQNDTGGTTIRCTLKK